MSLVGWCSEIPAAVDRIGGKAASVARLARLGLPAPNGFVVCAGAFDAYLEAAGETLAVRELCAALPDEEAAARLAAIVHEHPLPEPLASDLGRAVARLAREPGGRRLAVRSSGIQEDSADSSFAGQHETFLDVEPYGVELALRRCWASLWSPRAVAYRTAHGLPPAEPGDMAVLVQPLVQAVASAVVFTVNPVSGDREEIVVDAARGLGEQIVSGAVTADNIVLDRVTLTPRRALDGDGGETAITVAQAAELAEICLRAERSFRAPLDLEAAHDGERWWLLQARPITTVAPASPPDLTAADEELLAGVASGDGGGR